MVKICEDVFWSFASHSSRVGRGWLCTEVCKTFLQLGRLGPIRPLLCWCCYCMIYRRPRLWNAWKHFIILYWFTLMLNPRFFKCFTGCLTHKWFHTTVSHTNSSNEGRSLGFRRVKPARAEVKRRHWCQWRSVSACWVDTVEIPKKHATCDTSKWKSVEQNFCHTCTGKSMP